MLSFPALQALAFPWVLTDANDKILLEGAGTLFSQPETTVAHVRAAMRGLAVGGWGVCGAGFAIYRFASEAFRPNTVVLYGLKVNGISTAQGRSTGLSVRLEPEQLQRYVAAFCAGVESLDDGYRKLIRENIHEIRGINSGLYNTAYELQELIDSVSTTSMPANAPKLAQSVVRWSEMLSGRIDFMDFIANPGGAAIAGNVEIPVYRKFDKVQRCFRVTASQRRIRIRMSGASSGTVYGPPIFDIVPYLLLDNAVKYSPQNQDVEIHLSESNTNIFCRVTSMGPRIDEAEIEDIFNASVRGKNAVSSGIPGSGLGLPVVRRVVESFGGQVTLVQSTTKLWLNAVPYTEISFEVKLPIRTRA